MKSFPRHLASVRYLLLPAFLVIFLSLAVDGHSACPAGSVADPNGVCILDAVSHPKFVNQCPNPLDPSFIWQPTTPGGNHYEIGAYQFQQNLGLVNPTTGAPLTTTVWGYGSATQAPTYPGRTFLINKGTQLSKPITVRWYNNLVNGTGNPLPHLLPVDSTLDWADPFNDPPNRVPGPYTGPVPICMHLHGGHTDSLSDGLPDAWFTSGYAQVGRLFNEVYTYPMDQEAATIWYHDHALGITRLNVYAGLAGFCIVRDSNEDSLNLPKFPYEIPLAIQDRMFTSEGQLYYPTQPSLLPDNAPSAQPEMFGDFILVNGKAWPVLDVQPRLYRLHLLNGSDSRFYNLAFYNKAASTPGPAFNQIGSDGGLLNTAVRIAWPSRLTIAPGERMDVLVDFSAYAGQTLVIINNANSPFPDGDPVDPETNGQIMAFRVAAVPAVPGVIPTKLRAKPVAALTSAFPGYLPGKLPPTRKLILAEATNGYGRLEPLLGTVADGVLQYRYPITEKPTLGSTEIWEFYNTTPDAHPIHLHLVQFQVLSRQAFTATVADNGSLSNIVLGKPFAVPANEKGWKDTAAMYPGTVTRVVAKFDMEGEYVWHCHILSHEDHEMMRPFCVNNPFTNNCNCTGPAGCP